MGIRKGSMKTESSKKSARKAAKSTVSGPKTKRKAASLRESMAKKSAKRTTKKAAKKSVKKAVKKTAKKSVKKAAKKRAKKSVKKAVKKTAQSSVKKAAKGGGKNLAKQKGSHTGLFISLEGGEGAGKSTQIEFLKAELERLGHTVVVTREPGGSPRADIIRELILDDRLVGVNPMAELMLYEASRAQHVAEVIRPALERGDIVLCDRFVDSSVVYQGKARGIPTKQVEELNLIATEGLLPEITFFFDLDPKIGLGRIGSRGVIDRMEREKFEFHQMVYDGYKELAKRNKKRIKRLDATQSRAKISSEILEMVLRKVKKIGR